MTDNPSVNRKLDDPAIDHMDHALGRPVWPRRESYRNYYATYTDSPDARHFEASPHWKRSGVAGRMAYYHVTESGREVLAAYLAQHDCRRAFVVTFAGHDRIMPARTRSGARYAYFQQISDCLPDLRFGEFLRQSSVRSAA